MELTNNRRVEKHWSEEFTKIVSLLSASNPNDNWTFRSVDRLPTDPSAPCALSLPDDHSMHSIHSTDSSSKEELPIPPESSQDVSLIDHCEELPNPPEFSADYDEVEIVNARIYPVASSPSPLPPLPLPYEETKEERISLLSEIQTGDESLLKGNSISTDAPSVNIEIPANESLIVVGADESRKNSFASGGEFQNENGIDVQIITARDISQDTLPEELQSQPPEASEIAQQTPEQVSEVPVVEHKTEEENSIPEVIVTLSDVETEIVMKTEKLYDTLDKYVQSCDDWVQIEDPQSEIPESTSPQSANPSFVGVELTIEGNDLSETSTAESFHFISTPEAPEAPQVEALPLSDETAPLLVEDTIETTSKGPTDLEINEASWKLERRKLIISRKGSMGRFLGRIMNSKRLHSDRLPAARPHSVGEPEPPKRPPRRKTLANLDLSKEGLNDPQESKKASDSERSATLTSMDRRRKGSMSRLMGRVLSARNITSVMSPEDPGQPPERPPPPLSPPVAELKRDSFGEFLRRIIPNRSRQSAEVPLPDGLKTELPVESIPVQTIPMRPDGWTAPTVKTAKVQFQCQRCQHKWSSARGVAAFTFQLAKNEESGAGYGEVVVRFFGQQCYLCPSEDYEEAEWSSTAMRRILSDVCAEIGQQFYPDQSEWKRLKTTKAHRQSLCQACNEGVCTSKKTEELNHSAKLN